MSMLKMDETSGRVQTIPTVVGRCRTLLCILGVVNGLNYVPHQNNYYVSDYIPQEVMDGLSNDLILAMSGILNHEAPNGLQTNKLLTNHINKDMDNEETTDPVDFEGLSDNPSPSIRDQEYLQHSSLWGHQFVAGGAGEGAQKLKPDGSVKNQQQVKSDSNLPAYCNPPNPCPAGYTGEEGCLENFENTAAFSRDYQRSQDCMCDSEHMFECSDTEYRSRNNDYNNRIDLDRVMEELSGKGQHKNLVAKKYHIKKNNNPFLVGERLPVAAKKGINLVGG